MKGSKIVYIARDTYTMMFPWTIEMEIAGEMKREGSRHAALPILNNAEAISKHKQLSGKCSRKLGLPFFG